MANRARDLVEPVKQCILETLRVFCCRHLMPLQHLPMHELFYFNDARLLEQSFSVDPRSDMHLALTNSHYILHARAHTRDAHGAGVGVGDGDRGSGHASSQRRKKRKQPSTHTREANKRRKKTLAHSVDSDDDSEGDIDGDRTATRPSTQQDRQAGLFTEHGAVVLDPISASLEDICLAYRLYEESGRVINLCDWFTAFLSIFRAQYRTHCPEEAEVQIRFFQAIKELKLMGYIKPSSTKIDHVVKLAFRIK